MQRPQGPLYICDANGNPSGGELTSATTSVNPNPYGANNVQWRLNLNLPQLSKGQSYLLVIKLLNNSTFYASTVMTVIAN